MVGLEDGRQGMAADDEDVCEIVEESLLSKSKMAPRLQGSVDLYGKHNSIMAFASTFGVFL